MNKAPAASRKDRSFRGDETPMILIAPFMMPAAPVPETALPAIKIVDEGAAAQVIEPAFGSQTLDLNFS